MEIQGCDRRILKAFYTQYVAVLLIMLTFTIGAFQRATQAPMASPQAASSIEELAPFGEFVIAELFGVDGSVPQDNQKLLALASIVRNHDVAITLGLSLPRLSFEADSSSVRRALRRIQALENFFVREQVPLTAVRFIATNSTSPENDLSVKVAAAEAEEAHGL
jgi:hypothetical protein